MNVYRAHAVHLLGLPTDSAITHKQVHHAYEQILQHVHEPRLRAILSLIQQMANDHVYARGWHAQPSDTLSDRVEIITATTDAIDLTVDDR